MTPVYKDLYQFTDYIAPIQLSLHQYLLLTQEPVLIHTGSYDHTERILFELKKLLDSRPLKYILVSHFESDECGGLSILQKEYPEAITVCSQICARQLSGFGYHGTIMPMKAGDVLTGNDFEFTFIDYPSEIHLWDGITFVENKRKIFFSSDLMFRLGESHNVTITGTWKEEVESINSERVADPGKLIKLKDNLSEYHPQFIAVGHGPCVNLGQ